MPLGMEWMYELSPGTDPKTQAQGKKAKSSLQDAAKRRFMKKKKKQPVDDGEG